MDFLEIVWPLPSTITASIDFLFELIFGAIVATEASKVIGDAILEARVNSGKSIRVGKKWGLGKIIYMILAGVATLVTGIAVADVEEVKYREVIRARHLRDEHVAIREAG